MNINLDQLISSIQSKPPTYSQTKRLLRELFGPHARVKREGNTIMIGIQQGNVFVAWGEGGTYQDAFLHAFRDSLLEAFQAQRAAAMEIAQKAGQISKSGDSVISEPTSLESSGPNSVLETPPVELES